jgi:hypothetical protein
MSRVVIIHQAVGFTSADQEMLHSGNHAVHSFSVREHHSAEVFVLRTVAEQKYSHSFSGKHCHCCHTKEEGLMTQILSAHMEYSLSVCCFHVLAGL